MFPPHARGWTRHLCVDSRGDFVSPARAGMDRQFFFFLSWFGCFPRTRGDGPGPRPASLRARQFPPHARGWTPHWRSASAHRIVSPARAGMDPSTTTRSASGSSFPRTRGDGPPSSITIFLPRSFPPHARGWTCRPAPRRVSGRVSPARAGMDPQFAAMVATISRFPRTRGDGPDPAVMKLDVPLFPPARAGMDPSLARCVHRMARFPRTRGDGPSGLRRGASSRLFPPHARGWTPRRTYRTNTLLVSPARAGMDPCRNPAPGRPVRFPRTRGDGPPPGKSSSRQ